MIDCLVKSDNEGLHVPMDVLERAMRPSIPHTVGPGKWTIDVGRDRFVDQVLWGGGTRGLDEGDVEFIASVLAKWRLGAFITVDSSRLERRTS